MTVLRNYFMYRRMAKPTTPCRDRRHPTNGLYDQNMPIAGPSDPEAVLLRTARAERALYYVPDLRAHGAVDNRAAATANRVGVKCFEYNLPGAFRNFMDALAEDPRFTLARNNLGLAYVLIGDADQAIRHLGQAIANDERLDAAYTNRGAALLEQGDYEAARRDFNAAIRIDPGDPMHHNNMGVLWLDAGQPETAIECFRNAIRLDQNHPTPHRNIGYSYRELGDHETAAEQFDLAYELEAYQCPLLHTPN